jgi:hypothetical protein
VGFVTVHSSCDDVEDPWRGTPAQVIDHGALDLLLGVLAAAHRPLPRPVIGWAASAARYIASISSSDFRALPRTFFEQVSNCSERRPPRGFCDVVRIVIGVASSFLGA